MTEENRKLFKMYYEEWVDKIEARKNLNKEITEEVERASQIADIKKENVRKVFSMMKKREEKGEDELDELNTVFAELEIS